MFESNKLTDRYDREINYFRISITDRCNLRCLYCKPHDLIPKLSHSEILSYEEILRLVKISKQLGITKVRITGGEPLIRKDVCHFLRALTAIDGLSDVSLTTNGVYLKENLEKIKSAGIERINISIDTLNKRKFKQITGHDYFNQVWEGIELAQKMGMTPIKLNVVALRGINDDEIADFAKLSLSYPFQVRFIEYMAIGNSETDMGNNILTPEIKDRIKVLGQLEPVEKKSNSGPAQIYKLKNAKGEIGFISALSQHFCHSCNRLRLTASGQLRPCLLSDKEEDLKGPMRNGCSDSELANLFIKAIKRKGLKHQMTGDQSVRVARQMSSIGG